MLRRGQRNGSEGKVNAFQWAFAQRDHFYFQDHPAVFCSSSACDILRGKPQQGEAFFLPRPISKAILSQQKLNSPHIHSHACFT